jgi:predicted NodU family carbamoyl transferase
LKLNIKDSATERVAQQLIEHLNPKLYLLERKILEDEQEQVLNKSFNLNDRDIIRSKKAEASLDQLKD